MNHYIIFHQNDFFFVSYLQLVMAASVYATPPPDHLSGDETALSDVSNSSQLSSPANSMKTLKRSLSATSILSSASATENQTQNNNETNATIPFTGNINITLPSTIAKTLDTLATSNGTSNSSDCINVNSLSSLLLDSLPLDNSKKRRKQSTPIRLSEPKKNGSSTGVKPVPEGETGTIECENMPKIDGTEAQNSKSLLPRIYLSNLSQLQEKQMEITETQKENEQIEQLKKLREQNEQFLKAFGANNLSCDQCGLRLQSEIQLGLHILQEHGVKNASNVNESKSSEEETPKIFVKKELSGNATGMGWNDEEKEKPSNQSQSSNGALKPEDWLASLPGLPFGFPPEAAAMLSASGYFPQMPLLGVNPFAAADGLPRTSAPPLRIFNPEAYCDLCNKEFCNKYFLKTHKANKHNIYESTSSTSASEPPSTSQLNQMTQFFQMQQQQLAAAHQQQIVSPGSPNQQSSSSRQSPISVGQTQGNSSSQENTVLCDICFKRYPNTVAMRRHRSKAHEIPPVNETSNENKLSTASNNCQTDGFREDLSIEQEDASFTPQPRKLSPQSILLAREANFSADKLKRLGVINPEAFCEICCKEYCNKYFLRTHKLKRHNILIPMDDTMLKDERAMAAAAAASAWQLMQNAPLNLIMSNAEAFSQLHSHARKKLEAGEIRKLSTESMDDELEQPIKRQKLIENDKKSIDENDDMDDGENKPNQPENENIDLQKLQSMIMQLNDLSAQRPAICAICGKEQENQFALHSHMLTEHANIGDNNNGHKMSPRSSPVINQTCETCKQCDKEFPNAFSLTQHLLDTHGIPSTSPIREGFVTPERPISGLTAQAPNVSMSERRPYIITPTSSYCEICNKELCNKYFMKTHMQRMHGIEIENGAQIGGVVCNVCNKELCSKYFLRVHKQNTHGIVDDGSPLPQPRQNGDQLESESMYSMDSSPKSSGEINQIDLTNRYYSHYNEVCPLCNRRFRGSKWLRAHLLADHGKSGTDKLREIEQQLVSLPKTSTSPTLKVPSNGTFSGGSIDPNFLQKQALNSFFGVDESLIQTAGHKSKEYQCSFCSFSTSSYAYLYMHKRTIHPNLLGEAIAGLNIDAEPIDSTSNKNQSTNDTLSNRNTPISTPATTPIPILESVGSISATNLVSLTQKENPLTEAENLSKQEIKLKSEPQQQCQPQPQSQRQDQQDAQNVLAEMANLTKRPTTYAIPQELSNGMFMQSFLMEPLDNTDDANAGDNKPRFVPSVVFLPVRERITGKTTISFSLTPA